ncbi:MAG: transporter substrate-binding domain-containing protein [Desulfarculus sp.]|nr:transporter substrate-binding domain-containing protein [Desulfarculus sp.]
MARYGWRTGLAVLAIWWLLAASLAAAAQPLTIACEQYPPYEFLENGQPRGLCVELVQEACQRLGLTPEFRFMAWTQAQEQVRTGQVQAIMSLYRTPERERFLVFPARQLAEERVAAVVRKDSGVRVRGVDDLAGLRVGVNAGYAYGPVIDELQGLNKVEVTSLGDLLRDLVEGKTDVALGNEMTMIHLAFQLKLTRKLEIQRIIYSAPLFIGFAKAQGAKAQELADGFDRVLKALEDEGLAARIRAQY